MGNTIILAWPPRDLHPNSRPHFHARASAAKAYREAAYWIAKAAAQPHSHPSDGIPVRIDFYPPDRRKRDLDGMLSSIKAGIDGIADAYELNDYELNPVILNRRDPVRGGKVEVLLA